MTEFSKHIPERDPNAEFNRLLDRYLAYFDMTLTSSNDGLEYLKLVWHNDPAVITEDPDIRQMLELCGVIPVYAPSYFEIDPVELPVRTGNTVVHERVLEAGTTRKGHEFRLTSTVTIYPDGFATEILHLKPGKLDEDELKLKKLEAFLSNISQVQQPEATTVIGPSPFKVDHVMQRVLNTALNVRLPGGTVLELKDDAATSPAEPT